MRGGSSPLSIIMFRSPFDIGKGDERPQNGGVASPGASSVLGGDWGVSSEVGELKVVLLCRPGVEIEGVIDPTVWRWREIDERKDR